MKHTPIEKPQFIGCLNCSPVPKKILSTERILDVGFGFINLVVDGKEIWEVCGGCDLSVEWLTREYRHQLEQAECSLLHFNGPLRDKTYEYNKEDGTWYLVKQGMGFA